VTDGGPPVVGFSTLACPDWDADTVIRRAAAYRFDGIEWRGGPDGTVRTAWPLARRRAVRAALEQAGVAAIAVTAYPNLISGDPVERASSVLGIVDHVTLAGDLGAPAVRVFVGIRDDVATEPELWQRAIAGLRDALDRTSTSNVVLAIEPHDDHVGVDAVQPILDAIPDPRLGVVWDIANAWAAREAPAAGLAAYGGRISYVQVKDGTGRGTDWRLCALGAGDVPLGDALDGLIRWSAEHGVPVPPISVEWERAWHPELAPPEVALPAARRWLVDRFGVNTDLDGGPSGTVAAAPGGRP
jgi:sugar phosphate isomerase/epimerase